MKKDTERTQDENDLPEDGTLNDKTKDEKKLSPNELLFGKAEAEEGEKPEPKPKPKGWNKKKLIIASVAAVTALSLVITVIVMALTGTLRDLKERYIYSPDKQLAEALKRYAVSTIDSIEEGADPANTDGTVRHEGSIGVSVHEDCLDILEKHGDFVLDSEYFDLINGLKLYYELYSDNDGVSMSVNMNEHGTSLGAVGVYSAEPDALYLAIPALTDALLGEELGFDIFLPSIRLGGVSAEEKEALSSLSGPVIESVTKKIGEVKRERVSVDYEGEDVKCDKLSFRIDKSRAHELMDYLLEVAKEESELMNGIFLGGTDGIEELIQKIEGLMSDRFALNVDIWVKKGEVIGMNLQEESSKVSFSRMKSGNTVGISTKVLGFTVSLSGSYADGSGDLSLSVVGFNIASIKVEDFSFVNGIPDGKVSVSVSNAVLNLIKSYAADDGFAALIGEGTLIGDLIGYKIVFDFEAEGDDYLAQIKVQDPESGTDMLTLAVDGNANGDTAPFDIEGKDKFTLDEFDEYRDTVKLTRKLMGALSALPKDLRSLLGESLQIALATRVYMAMTDEKLEEEYGDQLDYYLDPIFDAVEELIP